MEKKIILFTINRKRVSKKLKSDLGFKLVMIISEIEKLKKELKNNKVIAFLIDGSLNDQMFLNSLIATEQAIENYHLDTKIFIYKNIRKFRNFPFLKNFKELRNYL